MFCCCSQEHKCVLDSCRALEGEGYRVTYLPVSNTGLVNVADVESAIGPDTSLVSIMTVNNEIGVKQPIADIGNMKIEINLVSSLLIVLYLKKKK